METFKEKQIKENFIQEIIQEINEIPINYLRTLYAIVHTFKENILIVEPVPQISPSSEEKNDDFDWDELIDEIHQERQRNNLAIQQKMDELFS